MVAPCSFNAAVCKWRESQKKKKILSPNIMAQLSPSINFSPIIKVEISDTQIIIEDNGIGMNDDILTNNYWKAGNSGKNNPQAIAAGVVGHFGIGALANFGVCTKLEIQTHRFGEEKSFTSVA